MGIEKLAKASSRLESVCGSFMKAFMDLEDAGTLVPLLQDLEAAHLKIVMWIAARRGVTHAPSVMFTKDVRQALRGKQNG